ncbi:MerR family transcriptional regulator [Sporomusa aerivorans]|uniref:MerR family transcriptional regulator n=1 Tax=Sporomusa aerivorans TaxID=204936 RepID=UPI00352B1519
MLQSPIALTFFIKERRRMNTNEASKHFPVSMEKLQYYEQNGLLESEKLQDGSSNYKNADFRRIGLIHFLLDAGLELNVLKEFVKLLDSRATTKYEQIRILRKQRYKLLDDIHDKQQSLDQLDYLIHEIKKTEI